MKLGIFMVTASLRDAAKKVKLGGGGGNCTAITPPKKFAASL